MQDRFDIRQDKSTWLEMATQLRSIGWDIQIVAARSTPEASDFDGLVHYVVSINVPLLFRIVTMFNSFRFLRRAASAGDTVLLNEDSLWLAPMIRCFTPARVHLDIRSVPVVLPGLKAWLDRLLFWRISLRFFANLATSYSFITRLLQSQVEEEFGHKFSPVCIWESGVNTDMFKPVLTANRGRQSDRFNLLYHGSIVHSRGIDLVLRAMVVREFTFNLTFTIVGGGPALSSLKALAESLGLKEKVHFYGYIPYQDVVQRINEADCCICPLPDIPEWRVSSPLKVFEYLSCEKPVILTPLPAHTNVAHSLESVTWTRDFGVEAIADAIIEAWSRRVEAAAAAGAGRNLVIRQFDWKVHANTLGNLLAANH